MFKTVALLKARQGLSREDFIEHYENRHVPLIRQCLPQICDYRRNFIQQEGAIISVGASAPDFDVITEMWYPDRAAFDEAMAMFPRPEVYERIAQDEERFLDRSKTRLFIVEERQE